jgi:hypothetical protein
MWSVHRDRDLLLAWRQAKLGRFPPSAGDLRSALLFRDRHVEAVEGGGDKGV